MSAAGRIASLIEGLSEGDAELKEPLHAELKLLFACPQVRLPAANQKIFFNGDAKLPPCKQRAQQRGIRLSFWCCGQYVKRCNDKAGDEACPTLLEVVKQTRERVIAKHSSAECLQRMTAKREEAMALQPAPPELQRAPLNAFEALKAGQLASQRSASAILGKDN